MHEDVKNEDVEVVVTDGSNAFLPFFWNSNSPPKFVKCHILRNGMKSEEHRERGRVAGMKNLNKGAPEASGVAATVTTALGTSSNTATHTNIDIVGHKRSVEKT
jgi:hypothetical protein